MATPLRVLIVEDSQDDMALMLHELERGGFELTAHRVATASEMQAALERERWDVVLADYNMPGFSAMGALELVRDAGRDVPFVIVSGSIGEELAVASMHAGAHDYVMKDNLARLVPAVKRELREAAGRRARREAEQALRDSELRYRSLVEHSSDIITVTDAEGTILFQSPSVERVLGYKPEEMIGRNGFEFIHPDDVTEALDAFRDMMETGKPFGIPETRTRHKDGSWRTLEIVSTTVTTHEGLPAVLATSRDITERRLLEEQFRQSQKMEAVGRLAGGVAHDFNNLLTAIMGYSEMLLASLPDKNELRHDVEEIRRASERAAALTSQLLAFSRRQVMSPRVLDLNQVVANLDDLMRRLIGEDIELVTLLGSDLGRVKADPGQIEQVVLNLVVNSRDAMAEGGRLTIETANVDLDDAHTRHHVSVQEGAYVMLAVSDTGHGMDAETRNHLFEPFFTTKEKGKGTGLGLSTVYGIIRQSGGNLWVYSEVGQGTTIKVYLPRVHEPIDELERFTIPDELPRASETVLLVEDDDMVRGLVGAVLRSQGYAVLEARDGPTAIAMVEAHRAPIDIMVTDVVMPVMSGRQLADNLAALRPEMRVLFVSGYTDSGIVRQGLLDPRTAFLQKPFTPATLARKVREVLLGAPLREAP